MTDSPHGPPHNPPRGPQRGLWNVRIYRADNGLRGAEADPRGRLVVVVGADAALGDARPDGGDHGGVRDAAARRRGRLQALVPPQPLSVSRPRIRSGLALGLSGRRRRTGVWVSRRWSA